MLQYQHNDIGDQIIYTLATTAGRPVNVSGSSNVQFVFRRPDAYVYAASGSLYSDGTDGKFLYVSGSGDFVVTGIWRYQVEYALASGFFSTPICNFEVVPTLWDGI